MMIATVAVGFTVSRPIVPDERMARVRVAVPLPSLAHLPAAEVEATLLAAQIVAASAPGCEMPTSTTIEAVEF